MATATTTAPRPGGRSARIQSSVHAAVQALLAEHDSGELTVPQIAQQAGVTPSTIYRRWGDLRELLADVAVQRMRPDTAPADTGALRTDLTAWTEQYLEEMSSADGQVFTRNAAAFGGAPGRPACQCAAFSREQLDIMVQRAVSRGEPTPTADALMDFVVSPIIYRILFDPSPPTPAKAHELIEIALSSKAT